MRIECPSCSAEYEVPAARVGSRRVVRCSRCGVEWTAEQEAAPPEEPAIDPPAPDHPPAPVIDASDRPALPDRTPPRQPGLIAAWIASVLLLAGAATASIVWRAQVTAFWPPSERLLGSGPAPSPAPPASAKPAQKAQGEGG